MRKFFFLFAVLVVLASGCESRNTPGEAAKTGPEPGTEIAVAGGATVFKTCTVCHGDKGQGITRVGAPAIAGREDWYLASQLRAFRLGYRGNHESDTLGRQMAVIARAMQEEAVEAVSVYVSGLPPLREEDVALSGNLRNGASTYNRLCGSCHGPNGGGNENFHAPSLVSMHAWYMERQMLNYYNGIRGTHPDDLYGNQMAMMAKSLDGSAAITDVVTFIQSLQP